jgi:hypothetical protein
VAPAPASATDATPTPPAHTPAGVVMVVEGEALIATLCEAVPEQPAPVWTVTERPVEPLVPAAKVMLAVPAPPVIVPLVIVQE